MKTFGEIKIRTQVNEEDEDGIFLDDVVITYNPKLGIRNPNPPPKPSITKPNSLCVFLDTSLCLVYRGTSLMRNTHPPRISIGP